MSEEKTKTLLLDYWKRAVGQYVREQREQAGKAQKELPSSRKTISDIENGSVNFTLSTLLDVLDAVGGNVSDAFRSRTPRQFRGASILPHEQLETILAEGTRAQQEAVCAILQSFHREVVDQRKAE